MSPIYRAEQARLSISSEAGRAGYVENATAASGATSTTTSNAYAAGTRVLTVADETGFTVGDYVRLEDAADPKREVRKIVRIDTADNLLYLDYPTGFYHASGIGVQELDAIPPTSQAGRNFSTFLPGVYETITTPDLTPEFLPQYFISANATRNFSYLYRGRQAFTGSLPNFLLLNGYPLKYPVGTVSTTGTDVAMGGGSTTSAATFVGDIELPITAGDTYSNGDHIQIDTGTDSEIRQIVSGVGMGAQTFVLNYPLLIAHGSGVDCNEVTSPFTHTINEVAELPSMTWNVIMIDSGETAANNFTRRFVGGLVNRATISADEGGLLTMAWDDVQFFDLIHDQPYHSSIGGGTSEIVKSSQALFLPSSSTAANYNSTYGNIGGDITYPSGTETAPTYPTTEPYYFSEGAITLFGITFARIRNFRLEINNNVEARYYIRDQATERIPSEFHEQRREYRMTATIGMEDSLAANATTRTLFKELIVEGNYGSGQAGFDMTLTFTRGTNDTITITIPANAASTAFEDQGVFITRGPHNIGTESPTQVDLEMMFRSMSIVVVDSIGVYP